MYLNFIFSNNCNIFQVSVKLNSVLFHTFRKGGLKTWVISEYLSYIFWDLESCWRLHWVFFTCFLWKTCWSLRCAGACCQQTNAAGIMLPNMLTRYSINWCVLLLLVTKFGRAYILIIYECSNQKSLHSMSSKILSVVVSCFLVGLRFLNSGPCTC
jgi:hypothetical protein